MKKWLIVLFFIACSAYAEQNRTTEVITLNYLTGEKAVQSLNPLLRTDEKMSYSNDQLIIDASAETLTKIKTVLSQIDVLPIVFEVSIHQDNADWLNREEVESETYATQTHKTAGNNQAIQVSSGESAFISFGANSPVISSVNVGWWQAGVAYKRMQTEQGMLIEPTALGSQVKLKIRRVSSQLNEANQQATNQQMVDTVTIVPQNRWVSIGSAGHAELADEQSVVSYTAGNTFRDNSTIYIKVTTLPSSPPDA